MSLCGNELKCHLQFVSIWTSLKFCRLVQVNSIPDNEILNLSKFKAFADDKNTSHSKIEICVGKNRKHCEKRENAAYQHFLLFPQCVQKLSFPEVLKVVIVW